MENGLADTYEWFLLRNAVFCGARRCGKMISLEWRGLQEIRWGKKEKKRQLWKKSDNQNIFVSYVSKTTPIEYFFSEGKNKQEKLSLSGIPNSA